MDGYETLLPYYQRELSFLRREGADFAQQYPQIARRLDVAGDTVTDPDVERLIESVAFLTARIQHVIDQEFPIIPTAMLDILYPQFSTPIPSMAIAQFRPPEEAGKLTTGLTVERGRQFFAASGEKGAPVVRFRTCYPATIWPLQPSYAGFDDSYPEIVQAERARSLFRLRLRSTGPGFAVLGVERLRVYLAGIELLTDRLYQMLTSEIRCVYVLPDGDASRRVRLPAASVEPVGFRPDEAVLPDMPYGLDGYRLLLELFQFPDKFRFLDFTGLDVAGDATMIDLLFPVTVSPPAEIHADPGTFRLGCTPVINLFRGVSQPIRLTGEKLDYPVLADLGDRASVEVHSIGRVAATPDPDRPVAWVKPYFGFAGPEGQAEDGLSGVPGDEMVLSFVDPAFKPAFPADRVLYAQLLCTNRRLAPFLPANQPLQPDEAAVPGTQALLTAPTMPLEPATDGSSLWQLVTQLALGQASLVAGDGAVLRQFLQLYELDGMVSSNVLIDALAGATATSATLRAADGASLIHGSDITLSFDDTVRPEGSLYILATVLDRVLPVFASANSFTRLSARLLSKAERWKSWPARIGDRPLL
mgnify:FL=1